MNSELYCSPGPEYEAGSVSEVFQLIDQVGKKLKQLQRQGIRGEDLTPSQYYILSLLWEEDEREFHQLASACCCARSTITGIVDTLEKKGLVTREPNPHDRRSILVKLTERGRTLKDSAPNLGKVLNGCCTGITPEDLRQLSQLLKKLDSDLSYQEE